MLGSRRQADVVDDPAYGSAVAGAARGRRGVWGALFMSVGTALVVAALLVYAPPAASASSRGPAPVERLTG